MHSRETAGLLGYIAANVRRLREKRGLSLERFAEEAGLDFRFTQRVERGRLNFSIETLVRLAAALDTTPGALLRRARLSPPKPGRPTRKPAR